MSLEPDLLLDRARLKRRIVFWRVLAISALTVALLTVVWHPGRPGMGAGPARIVRYSVDGIITDDRKITDDLAALATNPSVAALIVSIDSPGGSVAGGEGLHDAIAAVAARKPVVAVMRGEAASAGYMIAAPAARIFARQSTITGSIGVVMETGEVSGLLAKLGVTSNQIASGPMKGQPDPSQPLRPDVRAYLQSMIADLYDQFVDIVVQGRHLDVAHVRALADGRAYTGRQALPLGLIDQFGGERDARAWLAHTHAIPMTTRVVELEQKSRWNAWMTNSQFGGLARALAGLFGTAATMTSPLATGPMALWSPGHD